eukprot:3936548-Rhodomonas_salina.1
MATCVLSPGRCRMNASQRTKKRVYSWEAWGVLVCQQQHACNDLLSAYLVVRHEHADVADEDLCPALDLVWVVDVLEALCGVRVPDLLELGVRFAGVHGDVAVLLPARVGEPFSDEGLEGDAAAVVVFWVVVGR